jgi:hypothetical protein
MNRQPGSSPDNADVMFTPVSAAMAAGLSQGMQIYARQYEMLLRCCQALAKARGPEGIFAANTQLAADVFEGLNEMTALPAMSDPHAREIRA